MTFYLATLNGGQPIERFESSGNHFVVGGAHSRSNQGLRQTGVGVGQATFKPFPVFRAVGTVGIEQSICNCVGGAKGGAIARKGVEIFLKPKQGERTGARTSKFNGCGKREFEHTPCGAAPSRI